MKIPVFVSCPTSLNNSQENSRKIILKQLNNLGMEPRALGRSDYPIEYPLREVLVIAKHCSGAVILGFEQFTTKSGVLKRGTKEKRIIDYKISFPTPWNQLEAGLLFTLGTPLLVFKEKNISGGVFDPGVTDVFIHKMPVGKLTKKTREELKEVFLNWQRRVRNHYYDLNNFKITL